MLWVDAHGQVGGAESPGGSPSPRGGRGEGGAGAVDRDMRTIVRMVGTTRASWASKRRASVYSRSHRLTPTTFSLSMSWRASPPAPAPPVTSTSSNSLFGAQTAPAPRDRTVSTRSSSAAVHLARQKSVMDDDAGSIKSRRSTLTLSGNGKGRSRTGSVASKTTIKGSRSDDVEMDMEPARGTPSPATTPPNDLTVDTSAVKPFTPDAGVPAVVKRQKLEGSPAAELGRRSSWFGTGNWRGGGAVTETAPAMSPALSGDTPTSISAPTSPSRVRSTTAPATTASSVTYRKPVPPAPSPLATAPTTTAPPSVPFPLITTPAPLEAVPPPLSRRTSWFSLTSGTGPNERPSQPSPRPVSVVLDAIPDAVDESQASSLRSSSSERSRFLEVPGAESREREAERVREEEREAIKAVEQATITPASSRSWLSLLSISSLISAEQVPPVPVVNTEVDGTLTPPSTSFESQHEAIKPTSAADDGSITPTPSRIQGARATDQRGSWWGYVGYPDPPTVVEPVVEEVVVVVEPEPIAVELTPSIASSSSAEPRSKTWLRTIWGEFPQEAATRTAREAKQDNPTAQANALTTSAPKSAADTSVPPSLSSSPALPPPALKHKASWGFFPSRASSIAETIAPVPPLPRSSSTTTIAAPIPSLDIGRPLSSSKPVTVASKTPLGKNLNAVASSASSRTSSRSRGGGNLSAPNSPLLPPQSDAPLKPLTGSIRSSPRMSPQDDPPFENLVLPTFRDTFFRAPRSFPPKKSKLTKAVTLVSAYLFSVPLVEERRGVEMRRDDPAEKLPKSLEIMGGEVRLDRVKRVVTIGVHVSLLHLAGRTSTDGMGF